MIQQWTNKKTYAFIKERLIISTAVKILLAKIGESSKMAVGQNFSNQQLKLTDAAEVKIIIGLSRCCFQSWNHIRIKH